jgi:maleamate amidohydrolase
MQIQASANAPREPARYTNEKDMEKLNNTAVLIIDMLNDYFLKSPLIEHKDDLVDKINKVVHWARSHGLPIIWVRQEFASDLSDAFPEMKKKKIYITIAGTDGCRLLPELDNQEDDYEIVKKRYSAFFRTPLDELLKKLEVKRLIICGINTNACIRMAAIDAYQRDIDVIIPIECVYSSDIEHHEITLKYFNDKIAEVVTLEKLLKFV